MMSRIMWLKHPAHVSQVDQYEVEESWSGGLFESRFFTQVGEKDYRMVGHHRLLWR